jgi:hypothetical protein
MLKRFQVFLTELLNTVQQWEWLDKGPTTYQALFSIEGRKYQVIFEYRSEGGEDYYEFTFKLLGADGNGYGITGTGNELTVFATVLDILKAFVKLRPENRIVFAAKEESRKKLYGRLLSQLATRLPGYTSAPYGDDMYVIAPDYKNRKQQLFAPDNWRQHS